MMRDNLKRAFMFFKKHIKRSEKNKERTWQSPYLNEVRIQKGFWKSLQLRESEKHLNDTPDALEQRAIIIVETKTVSCS